jgi:S-adenosyl-L-methionine hydrolase (adenosine-forming)
MDQPQRSICFYSDYGYADDFTGVCRAVIKRLAPEVEVIDVTHGIAPQNVLSGAFVLRNTLPYMPERAVHLAVVDPGVGGSRRAVALRSGGDRLFVGPDNGLLVLAAEADGGIAAAVELTERGLWLEPLSATFHGRDVFAPVAARLAAGLALADAGRPLDPAVLVRLDLPQARLVEGGMDAHAVLIDRYGNVALDCDRACLDAARLGEKIELMVGGERYHAEVAATFSRVRPSDIVVLVDSYGQLAVCVREGSAADVLSLEVGEVIGLRRIVAP